MPRALVTSLNVGKRIKVLMVDYHVRIAVRSSQNNISISTRSFKMLVAFEMYKCVENVFDKNERGECRLGIEQLELISCQLNA